MRKALNFNNSKVLFKSNIKNFSFINSVEKSVTSPQDIYNFRYPDEIVKDFKDCLNNKNNDLDIFQLEIDAINNIHFFDSEQFTDLVCLMGKHNRGTNELWDILNRKIFDFEDFNFVQAKEILNSNVECYKDRVEVDFKSKNVYFSGNESKSQRETHDLLTKQQKH